MAQIGTTGVQKTGGKCDGVYRMHKPSECKGTARQKGKLDVGQHKWVKQAIETNCKIVNNVGYCIHAAGDHGSDPESESIPRHYGKIILCAQEVETIEAHSRYLCAPIRLWEKTMDMGPRALEKNIVRERRLGRG